MTLLLTAQQESWSVREGQTVRRAVWEGRTSKTVISLLTTVTLCRVFSSTLTLAP